MTAENFCYWLKGIFEIQEAGFDKNVKARFFLSESQIEMINQHLNYVFLGSVPTPKFEGSAEGTGGSSGSAFTDAITGSYRGKPSTLIC